MTGAFFTTFFATFLTGFFCATPAPETDEFIGESRSDGEGCQQFHAQVLTTTFFTALRTGFFGAAFDEPPNITGDAMEVRIAMAPVLTGATKPWHLRRQDTRALGHKRARARDAAAVQATHAAHVPMSARRTSLKKFMGREKAEPCCGETQNRPNWDAPR